MPQNFSFFFSFVNRNERVCVIETSNVESSEKNFFKLVRCLNGGAWPTTVFFSFLDSRSTFPFHLFYGLNNTTKRTVGKKRISIEGKTDFWVSTASYTHKLGERTKGCRRNMGRGTGQQARFLVQRTNCLGLKSVGK